MKLLFFSHNLNYALGWTVIHAFWQALIIAIVTGVLLIILQKKSSKYRYVLANIGLWSVLFAAITTFACYYDFSKQASELIFIPENKTSVEQIISQPKIDSVPTSFAYETNNSFSIAGLKNYFNHNMYFIVSLWFIGVIVFLLKILGGISYVYYLKNRLNFPAEEYWQNILDTMRKKANISEYIDLVESALVRSPIVIGHLKPMILFPIGAINRLNTNEVEAILAHELAHVMRHDYFFNILQSVIEALFYFHPAVWWLSSQIRTERENCCDDIAISLCGNAVTYAKSLVSVQEMAYYSPQMALAFAGQNPKKHLLMRVQRILNQPKSKVNIMEKITATFVLLVVITGFAFSSNHFSNNDNNTDKISKNADNQQNTSSFYLKYEQNGELDSLPLEKQIADGNYNFVNNLYDVNLTVKNQNVTQFKINGLEVDKKDMPKFEKMINELMRSKDEQNEDEIIAQIDENYNEGNISTIDTDGNNWKIVDQNGVVAELIANEKGEGRNLLIKKPNQEPISVSLEGKNNNIYIGGIKSNAAALKKLGWKVKGNDLKPLVDLPPLPVVPPIPPLPPTPPNIEEYIKSEKNRILFYTNDLRSSANQLIQKDAKNKRSLAIIVQKLAAIEQKIAEKQPDFKRVDKELDEISASMYELENREYQQNEQEQSTNEQQQNKQEAFDNWLKNELIKDNYLKNKNKYAYTLSNKSMTVDGKKVSAADRKKYLAMCKKMTGADINQEFSITKTYNQKED